VTSASDDVSAPQLAPVAPPRRKVRSRGRFFVVVTLLCAAVAVLLYKGLLSSLDYYQTVDYAIAHRAQLGTSSFRLEGVVVRGTVSSTPPVVAFSLSGANCQQVRVNFTGSPPQLFQPGIPVVVVGRFSSATSAVFLSNQIMIKHTANYVAAHPGRVTTPANGC
jgi:cytochrome c-type biogenesis protein CcmE